MENGRIALLSGTPHGPVHLGYKLQSPCQTRGLVRQLPRPQWQGQTPHPWHDDRPTQLPVQRVFGSFTSCLTGMRTACPFSGGKMQR